MPSRKDVRDIINVMSRRADYDYFFDNLDTADWLEPLAQEGLFQNPDAPIKAGNGIHYPSWAPSRYLARIAGQNPKKVIEIIKAIPDVKNTRIYDDFLDATLAMPVNEAISLEESIIHWLNAENSLLATRKVARLIHNLALSDYSEVAIRLSRQLLAIEIDSRTYGNESEFTIKRARASIRSSWEYDECVKTISPAFKNKGDVFIKLLIDLLAVALEGENRRDTDSFEDYSRYWRESLENSSHGYENEIKSTLVDWIKIELAQASNDNNLSIIALFDYLKSKKLPIFYRIILNFLKSSPKYSNQIRDYVFDEILFDCDDTWHEYALLVQSAFPNFSKDDQATYIQKILKITPSYITENEAIYAEYCDREKYKYLFLIRSFLTGEALQYYETLRHKYGELEDPVYSNFIRVWSGPNSPFPADQLKQMDFQTLAKTLSTWQPEVKTKMGPEPSIDGLAIEFEKVVTANADLMDSYLDLYKLNEYSYVRAVITGYQQALNSPSKFNWEHILNFVSWAISAESALHNSDIDAGNIEWIKMYACRLLEAGFHTKDNSIPIQLRKTCWSIIEIALKSSDPSPDREAKYSDDKNIYQLAINSVRGVGLDTAISYGLWLRKSNKDQGIEGPKLMPELYKTLDHHLKIDHEKSLAVRSVYGKNTPWLHLLSNEWFRSNLSAIFPQAKELEEYRKVAWEAYVLYSHPYDDLFEPLKDVYSAMVSEMKESDDTNENRSDSKLLQHIVSYYLRGKCTLESAIIQTLYRRCSLKQRGALLEYIGRGITQEKKNISPEMIARAKSLWESRVASLSSVDRPEQALELSQFSWWMGAQTFPEEWILDQALIALQTCHYLSTDHVVIGRLTGLANKHAQKVARIYQLIVDYKASDSNYNGWMYRADVLLRKLLKTEANKTAKDIINKIAAYGNREFLDLLKESQKKQDSH